MALFKNIFGGKKEVVAVKAPKGKGKKREESHDPKDRWFESEGQISIDLYKTGSDIVVISTIGGIQGDDLEITIQGDLVLLKGVRPEPKETEKDEEKHHFHQECYWGPFSRQIILPEEVDPSRAEAKLENGILIIRVPCIERDKKRTITVE